MERTGEVMKRFDHGLQGRGEAGFTLIELLIVIAIIGILAVIAVSTYQDQIVKSRRAAAAACLQEGAQFMERYYTTNLTYANATAPACDADIGGQPLRDHASRLLRSSASRPAHARR